MQKKVKIDSSLLRKRKKRAVVHTISFSKVPVKVIWSAFDEACTLKMEQLADTMIDLDVVVLDGILCLFSAWNIHGLTTSLPQAYHVVIKRGRKIRLPEYPLIELHFITEALLELGVEEQVVSGYEIKVYNKERSVCDAIKCKNKVGVDVCSEVVNSYLALSNCNLTLLMDYASKLRVTKTLENISK